MLPLAAATSGGLESLNRISASISGTSAGIRLPRGAAAEAHATEVTGSGRHTGTRCLALYLSPTEPRMARDRFHFLKRQGLLTPRHFVALDLQERYHTCVASAREFDPREIGLLYYVMASSLTLGDALKRVARYSQITNEALVVRYLEGNKFIIRLHYSGVPRHMDRHQIEF